MLAPKSTPNAPSTHSPNLSPDDTAAINITTPRPTTPTPLSSAPLPLTCGLEFEHILLFHSSLLTPLLPAGTQIQKSLSQETRLDLRQTTWQYQLSRPVYNGWGLTSKTTYPSPFGDEWHNECLQLYGVRGYADEGLRMEMGVLEKERGKMVNVHCGKGKMKDFARWHLVTDTSLVGLTEGEIGAVLRSGDGDRGTNDDKEDATDIDPKDWDSTPVELVTRVFTLSSPSDDDGGETEAAFAEINDMLTCLNPITNTSSSYPSIPSSTSSSSPHHHPDQPQPSPLLHHTLTNPHCGLHIHIGTPLPSGFPLPLLQHLAYILTIYEPVLSSLHPPWRRPGHEAAEIDLRSNREVFLEEPVFDDEGWELEDEHAIIWEDINERDLRSMEVWERERWQRVEVDARERERDTRAERDRDSGYGGSDEGCYCEEEKEVKIAPSCSEERNDKQDGAEPQSPTSDPSSSDDLLFELRIRHTARTKIFHPSTTISTLVSLLSGIAKGKHVNWLNLTHPPDGSQGPRTIEFRQHEGCLDAGEARFWVEFCAGLVRWAGRMAELYTERERERGEEEEEWFDRVYGGGVLGVEELVEGMGLDGEGREWVRGRVEMWRE